MHGAADKKEKPTAGHKPEAYALVGNWQARDTGFRITEQDGQLFFRYGHFLEANLVAEDDWWLAEERDSNGKLHGGFRLKRHPDGVVFCTRVDGKHAWGHERLAREEKVITFEPGQIGVSFIRESGLVQKVAWGEQAEVAGVKEGWTMVKIDGEAYSHKRFKAKSGGASSYEISFCQDLVDLLEQPAEGNHGHKVAAGKAARTLVFQPEMLEKDSQSVKENGRLLATAQQRRKSVHAGLIGGLARSIDSEKGDSKDTAFAMGQLRVLLEDDPGHGAEMVRHKLLSSVTRHLKSVDAEEGDPEMSEDALAVLEALAKETARGDRSVSALQPLLEGLAQLLARGNLRQQETAADLLEQLVEGNHGNKVAAGKVAGMFAGLIKLLESGPPEGQRKAAWLLQSLSVNCPENKLEANKACAVEALAGVLASCMPQVQESILGALRNLVNRCEENLEALLEKDDALRTVYDQQSHGSPAARPLAAEIIDIAREASPADVHEVEAQINNDRHNCELETLMDGDIVRILNLATAPQYNGKRGVIEGWDDKHLRWGVVLDSEEKKWLKPKNIARIFRTPAVPKLPAPTLVPEAGHEVETSNTVTSGEDNGKIKETRRQGSYGLDDMLDEDDDKIEEASGENQEPDTFPEDDVFREDDKKEEASGENWETATYPKDDMVEVEASENTAPPAEQQSNIEKERELLQRLLTSRSLGGEENVKESDQIFTVEEKRPSEISPIQQSDAPAVGEADVMKDSYLLESLPVKRVSFAMDMPTIATDMDTIKEGDIVRLVGLSKATHVNGLIGVCDTFDTEAGRWGVRMDNDQIKKIKPENLERIEPVSEASSADEEEAPPVPAPEDVPAAPAAVPLAASAAALTESRPSVVPAARPSVASAAVPTEGRPSMAAAADPTEGSVAPAPEPAAEMRRLDTATRFELGIVERATTFLEQYCDEEAPKEAYRRLKSENTLERENAPETKRPYGTSRTSPALRTEAFDAQEAPKEAYRRLKSENTLERENAPAAKRPYGTSRTSPALRTEAFDARDLQPSPDMEAAKQQLATYQAQIEEEKRLRARLEKQLSMAPSEARPSATRVSVPSVAPEAAPTKGRSSVTPAAVQAQMDKAARVDLGIYSENTEFLEQCGEDSAEEPEQQEALNSELEQQKQQLVDAAREFLLAERQRKEQEEPAVTPPAAPADAPTEVRQSLLQAGVSAAAPTEDKPSVVPAAVPAAASTKAAPAMTRSLSAAPTAVLAAEAPKEAYRRLKSENTLERETARETKRPYGTSKTSPALRTEASDEWDHKGLPSRQVRTASSGTKGSRRFEGEPEARWLAAVEAQDRAEAARSTAALSKESNLPARATFADGKLERMASSIEEKEKRTKDGAPWALQDSPVTEKEKRKADGTADEFLSELQEQSHPRSSASSTLQCQLQKQRSRLPGDGDASPDALESQTCRLSSARCRSGDGDSCPDVLASQTRRLSSARCLPGDSDSCPDVLVSQKYRRSSAILPSEGHRWKGRAVSASSGSRVAQRWKRREQSPLRSAVPLEKGRSSSYSPLKEEYRRVGSQESLEWNSVLLKEQNREVRSTKKEQIAPALEAKAGSPARSQRPASVSPSSRCREPHRPQRGASASPRSKPLIHQGPMWLHSDAGSQRVHASLYWDRFEYIRTDGGSRQHEPAETISTAHLHGVTLFDAVITVSILGGRKLRFWNSSASLNEWLDAFGTLLGGGLSPSHMELDDGRGAASCSLKGAEGAQAELVHQGPLALDAGAGFEVHHFVLFRDRVERFDNANSAASHGAFRGRELVTLNCQVREVQIAPRGFRLCLDGRIIGLRTLDEEDQVLWVYALRRVFGKIPTIHMPSDTQEAEKQMRTSSREKLFSAEAEKQELCGSAARLERPLHQGTLSFPSSRNILHHCALYKDRLDVWDAQLAWLSGLKPKRRILLADVLGVSLTRDGFSIRLRRRDGMPSTALVVHEEDDEKRHAWLEALLEAIHPVAECASQPPPASPTSKSVNRIGAGACKAAERPLLFKDLSPKRRPAQFR